MNPLTGHPTKPINYRLEQLYFCHSEGASDGSDRHHAEGTLHAPDGKMVPGGYYCRRHAEAIRNSYAEHLLESWTFRPFDQEATP